MDDVIFAGTSSGRRDFAEVSMSYRFLRRFRMTRRRGAKAKSPAGSSAGSAYRIDGRDVRAKDVYACCSPTPRPARFRPHWSARERSAPSSRPSRSNGACSSKRPPGSGPHVPQGRRAEAARSRGQSHRLGEILSETARGATAAPGSRSRALPQADRPDPRRRGAAAACRAGLRRSMRGQRRPWWSGRRRQRSFSHHQAIADAQSARASKPPTARGAMRWPSFVSRPRARASARDRARAPRHGCTTPRGARSARRCAHLRSCARGTQQSTPHADRAARTGAQSPGLSRGRGRPSVADRYRSAETKSREAEAALADLLGSAGGDATAVAEAALEAARAQLSRTEQERGLSPRMTLGEWGRLCRLGTRGSSIALESAAPSPGGAGGAVLRRMRVVQWLLFAMSRRPTWRRHALPCQPRSRNMTRWPQRSNRRIGNRQPLGGGRETSAPWQRRWAKMQMLPWAKGPPLDRSQAQGGAILSLPPGTERLAEHAARAFGIAAAVEADCSRGRGAGQVLSVGQRLVTRDGVTAPLGRLRREGCGCGGRLKDRRVPTGYRSLRTSFQAFSTQWKPPARSGIRGSQSMDQCRTAAEQARHAALAAEPDAREAARAIDAAAAALDRIEAQRSGFAQRQADLDPVLEAARGGGDGQRSRRSARFPIRCSNRTLKRLDPMQRMPQLRSQRSERKLRPGQEKALQTASA